MVFSSPVFIFLFLPVTLVFFLVSRFIWKKASNFVLLCASLLFYAWGEPKYILVMLASIVINYIFGLWIGYSSQTKTRKIALAISVTLNLLLLIAFKYANFIVNNLNSVLLILKIPIISIETVHLPIGISFFTFQAMSYVIDVYRKDTPIQKNPVNIALYISLFPQLIAGPIVRYHDIAKQIYKRVVSFPGFSLGVKRFIIGLGKKVLIANIMASVVDQIFALPGEQLTFSLAWLGIISYALQIYFDFSGYSDMAIGLGHMFGFTFLENFNYPYISRSIKEFWRRWHISLSTWFRDYLYIPLGGSQKGKWRTYFNLLIVFFLCGLWHGASWSFVVWGAFHGFFLILERTKFGRFIDSLWSPIRYFYTILVVLVGWCFFRAETLTYALSYLRAMFGFSIHTYQLNNVLIYLTPDVIIILFAGIIGSMPVYKHFSNLIRNKISFKKKFPKNVFIAVKTMFSIVFLSAVFFLCLMYLASDTYNPFIYFRF